MRLIVFKLLFGYVGLQAALWLGESPLPGLVVGIFFGHVLDYVGTMRLMQWRAKKHYEAQARQMFDEQFLASLFHMFGKICACDGAVVKEEINAVEAVIKDTLKLNRRDRQKAVEYFRKSRQSAESFQSSAVRFFEIYRAHPHVLEGTVQMFLNVASADGAIKDAEEQLIHTAATVFGIDKRRYQLLRGPFMPGAGGSNGNSTNGHAGVHDLGTLEKCYQLLGCNPEDPDSEVKKRYRKLVSEYHPDKIISKDLPEGFMEFANQKMKSIQQAYEAVKAERGFN